MSEENKIQSLRVFNTLYDRVRGIADENVCEYSHILARLLNLDHSTLLTLSRYLQGKNLVKLGIRASGIDYRMISLTKAGVEEVEAARENIETPVIRYPAGTISHVINYGNINQNSSSVSNVQANFVTNEIDKVRQFLDLLKQELPDYDLDQDRKLEAEADAKSIEGQVISPRPRFNIIKELGRHILDIVKPVASEGLKATGNSAFNSS